MPHPDVTIADVVTHVRRWADMEGHRSRFWTIHSVVQQQDILRNALETVLRTWRATEEPDATPTSVAAAADMIQMLPIITHRPGARDRRPFRFGGPQDRGFNFQDNLNRELTFDSDEDDD